MPTIIEDKQIDSISMRQLMARAIRVNEDLEELSRLETQPALSDQDREYIREIQLRARQINGKAGLAERIQAIKDRIADIQRSPRVTNPLSMHDPVEISQIEHLKQRISQQ